MEHTETILIAFGAIVAALIAATVSFTSLIISKEQKTSEFRQEWINGRYLKVFGISSPRRCQGRK
ncbi:MAG: hypothetical protein QXL01_02260 [Thermoplasmatales archaeon]